MNTAGGATWAAPGTIDSPGTTPGTPISGLTASDGFWGYWPAWWEFTFAEDTIVTLDASASTVRPSPTHFVGAQLYFTTGGTDEYDTTYIDGTTSGGGGDYDLPKFTFVASAGVTYKVVLSQYEPVETDNEISDYALAVTFTPLVAPANDDIANREVISPGANGSFLMVAATVEPGETDLFGFWGGSFERSVWYEFTAGFTGWVGFSVLDCDGGETPGPVWHLCQGTSLGDLTILDQGFAGKAGTAEVVQGETYLIRLASTDDDSITAQWSFRQYVWGEWQDNDSYTVGGGTFLIGAGHGEGPQQIQAGDLGSDAARGAWFASAIGTCYAASEADYSGDDDTFFLPPNSGTSFSATSGIYNEATGVGHVAAGLSPSQDLSYGETAQVMDFGTGSVETFFDSGGRQYEDTTAHPIAAHIELLWGLTKVLETGIWASFDGTYGVGIYYPTTSDRRVLRDDYQSQVPLAATSIVDGSSGTVVVDLDESAFASSASGYEHGIQIFGFMTNTQPTTQGSIAGSSQTATARLRGDVSVDTANSTFTFQRPRFRDLEPVEVSFIPLDPARRLWPRDDDTGPAHGRNYPPPNTQQYGRRFGSGAPV